MGWFREPGVMVTSIDEDNAWFNGKTDSDAIEAGKQVEANTAHDATSTYTADNAEGNNGFAGNDLFIASYQAQVLFRDANGVVLTAETGIENTDTSNDWYRYATGITPAIPQVKRRLKVQRSLAGQRRRIPKLVRTAVTWAFRRRIWRL